MVKIKKSKSAKQPFYFVVLAKNNKVVATSENYKTRKGAMKGIASLFKACALNRIFDETKVK